MAELSKDKYWIGVDLGGTKVVAVVFDRDFKIIGRAKKKSKGREGAQSGMDRVISVIEEARQEVGLAPGQLAGIGMACPGQLDLNKGIILEAPNLGWRNAKIKAKLEDYFHCPTAIANDVDAGVYGEYCFGAGKMARCVLGVFPGTGIGGGCVLEGKLIRGRVNSCMEVGHMQVMANGPLCGCGKRGCLEAVASRLAISAAAAAAAYRGEAPNLLKVAGMDLSNISSGVLASVITAGDRVVEKIVREAARWLGVGVANLVNILLPDVVILGGGLVEAMPKIIVPEVEEMARRRVINSFSDSFKIEVAQLGDNATATGAAALVRNSLKPS